MNEFSELRSTLDARHRAGQTLVGLLTAIVVVATAIAGAVGACLFTEFEDNAPPIHVKEPWVNHKIGDLTVSVPADWKGPVGLAENESSWYLGEPERPIAIFNILRFASYGSLIEDIDASDVSRIRIAGQEAMRYVGRVHGTPAGRRSLVVLDAPRPDGRRIGFVCFAREESWTELSPIFAKILDSVRIGP